MNNKEKATLNALIYYRVSTEEQAIRGVSLKQQNNACRRFADSNSMQVLKAFHDDGVSAKTIDRPGLQAMLQYCTKHRKKIDYVIVYKIDRLSRNMNDYTNILRLLSKLDIQLQSVTEAISETPMGQFIGNVMAANAQLDNQIRGQRTRDNMIERFSQGYWQWKAPIGYINTKDHTERKIVIPDSARAKHITWLFKEFSKGVESLESLRKAVNKKGLRTFKGNEISGQLMSKLIRNEFYAGWMENFGMRVHGVHKPLVSEKVFRACQKILERNTRGGSISKASTSEIFPLRNKIRCGYCFRPLTGGYSTGKSGKKYPYYRCYIKECEAPTRSIAKKKLEKEFVGYLSGISYTDKFTRAFKAVIGDVWSEQYKNINRTRDYLMAQLSELGKQKKKVVDAMKKGLMADDDFKEAFEDVKQEILKVEEELAQTTQQTFEIDEVVQHVLTVLQQLPDVWSNATYDQKILLQSLIFPKKPLYTYPKFETPLLSPILETKNLHHEDGDSLVSLLEMRPQNMLPL